MKKLLIFYFVVGITVAYGQAVAEPSASNIYNFLNRLSIKGLIEFNDELKPITRMELAGKLMEAEKQNANLTLLEREELAYYFKEFSTELTLKKNTDAQEQFQFFETSDRTGFRFLLFQNNEFTLNLDPILGLEVKQQFDESQTHRWNGLQFHGYYQNHWGFNFYFRDNAEHGDRIDKARLFSSEPGFNLSQNNPKSIEYVDVQGSVSYTWNSGNISIGKQPIEWGSGNGGKLIFSNKPPSFPFIKLEFSPASWLKFVYFHGWLHSGLTDSSSIRTTLVEDRNSFSQIEKYIAAHIVSIYPLENLSVSMGESIVYSDNIEFVYFIPVLFFRTADHYLSDSSNTGDNAQLFFNAVYKNYDLKSKFYATLFIDELSITKLLEGDNLSAVGFTAGLTLVEPFFENSDLTFEYTRLNPFVYMNSNDAQLFTSHNYQLGHWIGSNAHQYFVEYSQTLLRGLSLKVWSEYIAKGQKELPADQYVFPYPKFLYGNKLKLTNLGFNMKYEIMHSLFTQLNFTYSHLSDEDENRTPVYQLGKSYAWGISLSYGF